VRIPSASDVTSLAEEVLEKFEFDMIIRY